MLLCNSTYMDKQKIEAALENASDVIKRNIIKFQDSLPSPNTFDGTYKYNKIKDELDWQAGMWNGLVWLLYEHTKNETVKCYGEKITEDLCSYFEKEGLSCSDLGFLMIPSCVANYRFTRSNIAKESIITAADSLLTKYHKASNIICSFDDELEEDFLTCKISNLINIMILFHAYTITENPKYYHIAEKNIKLIIAHNILPNGKTYFRTYFNRSDGSVLNRDEVSCRFQLFDHGIESKNYAWALYGLAILYQTTKNPLYRDIFSRVFDFREKLNPSAYIFQNPGLSKERENVNNSSAAITVNALCTICKSDDAANDRYMKKAADILSILIDEFTPDSKKMHEGIIEEYSDFMSNQPQVHYSLMSDYFYYEALMNSLFDRDSFWYETK